MRYLVIGCLALLSALGVYAQGIVIDVTETNVQSTPIAVVPFRWDSDGTQPVDFAEVVSDDLRRSGLFDPMSQANMLSFPSSGQQISFRDWSISQTDYLLVGTARTTAAGIEASIELYNVNTQEQVLNRTVSGGPNNGRDVSHRVSDLVYETITGIEGIFGTKILYVSDATKPDGEPSFRLMMSDQDGAREQLVIESHEPIMSPTWSPDRKQIAYVSFETGRPAIYIQNLATGQREKITDFQGINGSPVWSPDGTKMAMVLSKDGNPEIYVMDLATKATQRVTNHFSIDTEPNWTPDGRSIYFTSDRGGRPQIYQADIANGRTTRLTFEGDYNARPRLSKDGRFLVMVHGRDGRFHIAVQDLQNDRVIIVSETSLDESPTIAPNGALVMYATKWEGQGILAVVSLDAGVKYRMPSQAGNIREPAWSPN